MPGGGPTPDDAVALDIGPGAGALVVSVPDELDGVQVDLVPYDDAATGIHVDVRVRRVGDLETAAAVFGSVAPGRYRMLVSGREDLTTDVSILQARVVELDLRSG